MSLEFAEAIDGFIVFRVDGSAKHKIAVLFTKDTKKQDSNRVRKVKQFNPQTGVPEERILGKDDVGYHDDPAEYVDRPRAEWRLHFTAPDPKVVDLEEIMAHPTMKG